MAIPVPQAWNALVAHQHDIALHHMRDWFNHDSNRFNKFSLQIGDILLDYSRNRVTEQTIDLLCHLAQSCSLADRIKSLFNGDTINASEKRPALHTALRGQLSLSVNGENISALITSERQRLYQFVERVRNEEVKGATGKIIRHVVNIGIGGSYLGPLMTTDALKHVAATNLQFHFISCVDKAHLEDVLAELDPETTLFIVSSKSFTTYETLLNAMTLQGWLSNKLGTTALAKHFIAITSAFDKAVSFGIAPDYIFPVWEWVGGRYSIWSAIGLPLMLMIGTEGFDEFLAGANEMDMHFQQADLQNNMPVIMALLGIWYIDFFDAKAHVIAPYSQRLRHLITYLQQADMESNGKMVNQDEELVAHQTAPVIFGEAGCNAQHTYHQMLHQGPQLIPVDFILLKNQGQSLQEDVLFASAISQAQALMSGQTYAENYRSLPGNRPSNILLLNQLTPRSLGALLALYEHKIFVQGVIWNVNPFDQWGVELGKQLMPTILSQVQSGKVDDPVLKGLIDAYRSEQHEKVI